MTAAAPHWVAVAGVLTRSEKELLMLEIARLARRHGVQVSIAPAPAGRPGAALRSEQDVRDHGP